MKLKFCVCPESILAANDSAHDIAVSSSACLGNGVSELARVSKASLGATIDLTCTPFHTYDALDVAGSK